jgi:hypothetical protein
LQLSGLAGRFWPIPNTPPVFPCFPHTCVSDPLVLIHLCARHLHEFNNTNTIIGMVLTTTTTEETQPPSGSLAAGNNLLPSRLRIFNYLVP